VSGPAGLKVSVCTTCHLGREGFLDVVRRGLTGCVVEGIDCMSGCAREQTVAFRSPGKVAYLFGEITEADLPELADFARLYSASRDGTFDDARILGGLRLKALARIPG
jgi:predicted metal-binding protein